MEASYLAFFMEASYLAFFMEASYLALFSTIWMIGTLEDDRHP
jgi:hypothetical protein